MLLPHSVYHRTSTVSKPFPGSGTTVQFHNKFQPSQDKKPTQGTAGHMLPHVAWHVRIHRLRGPPYMAIPNCDIVVSVVPGMLSRITEAFADSGLIPKFASGLRQTLTMVNGKTLIIIATLGSDGLEIARTVRAYHQKVKVVLLQNNDKTVSDFSLAL